MHEPSKLTCPVSSRSKETPASHYSGSNFCGELVRELMGEAEGAVEDHQRAKELGYDDQDLECAG